MKQYIWAALSALLAFSAASAASAQTYTYNFTGHFNSFSGNLTGQFTYNQNTDTFSAASVSTTAGNGPSGPAPAQTYTVVNNGSAGSVLLLAGPVGTGQRFIILGFGPTLVAGSPAISSSIEGTCDDPVCGSQSFNRQTYVTDTFSRTLVSPAPVPTLSEWAMILFGTLLAGSAALYIQRRQMVV